MAMGIGGTSGFARGAGATGGPSVARPVLAFVLSGLAALALVVGLGAILIDRLATEEATRDARSTASLLATGIVEPAILPGLVTRDPAAVAMLDDVVRTRVLDDSVVRLKVWDGGGTVLYSDAGTTIGERFALGDDALEALRSGVGHAELSTLDQPENASEQGLAPVLEVYQPVTDPSGTPLLLEIYVRYDSVLSDGRTLMATFLPALVVALAILFAVQVPLAIRLSRQLRDRHREREGLLHQALQASDAERRRIAAHLHDGVVQDLTALSFDLQMGTDAASRRAAAGVRRASRQLRALMIDLYPPNLRSAGLRGALEDLLEPLAGRGIETSLTFEPPADLDAASEVVVYRVAREAIRNAGAHADPRSVAVLVGERDGLVTLEVRDDGAGFADDTAADRAAEGHIGLRLMFDVARDAGRHLHIDSAPGAGTLVRLDGRT